MNTPNRLRWKKEPKETGLASVARDPDKRSITLHDGVTQYATVSYFGYSRLSRNQDGCYWSCPANKSLGIDHYNSVASGDGIMTEKEAKDRAKAYVVSQMKAKHA